MTRERSERTYRLKQIPIHIDRYDQVASLLDLLDPEFGPPDNIEVFSLAVDFNPRKSPPSKNATVKFKRTPKPLDNDKASWRMNASSKGYRQNILIDVEFWAFTSLSNISPSEHLLDCIAISGLASHPFGSWMSRDDNSNFMWLRDRMPIDLPQIRSVIYGYDTALLKSRSTQTIDDVANTLNHSLRSIGRAWSDKSVIFLAHSLGGLVLKRALVSLATSTANEDQRIFESVKQIMLFGVPNRGMYQKHWLPMVEGQPNKSMIELLAKDSTYLKELDDRFSGLVKSTSIRVVSIFETLESPTMKELPDGRWARQGPPELLVERASAIHGDTGERDYLAINRDHSNLVKFAEDDENYGRVISFIYDLVETEQHTARGSEASAAPLSDLRAGTRTRHKNKPTRTEDIHQVNSEKIVDETSLNQVGLSSEHAVIHDLESRSGKLPLPKMQHINSSNTTFRNKRSNDWNANSEKPAENLSFEHAQQRAKDLMKNTTDSLEVHGTYYDIPVLNTVEAEVIKEKMMRSLHIEETEQRRHDIEHPHALTFEWVFDEMIVDFVPWLRKSSGLYWIRGKAGSGKSTLMKYIYESQHTRAVIAERVQRKQVIASFFFHGRGTVHQKSVEGLLSSILWQILSQAPGLKECVLPIFLDVSSLSGKKWSYHALILAFTEISRQEAAAVDVLLFLDALDEYDGEPETVIKLLQLISSQSAGSKTVFQVVCSSREWEVFRDSFRFCSGFPIHDYTRDDIQKYVQDEIAQMHEFPIEYRRKLLQTIVEKADGVFLWVSLSLHSISEGAYPGVAIQELESKTKELPPSLAQMYENIFSQLSPHYMHETYAIFELVTRAAKPLNVPVLAIALACAYESTVSSCYQHVQDQVFSSQDLEHDLRNTLQLRAGNLVVLKLTNGVLTAWLAHQTVKDFIERPGFWNSYISRTSPTLRQNGHSFMGKAAFTLLYFRELRIELLKRCPTMHWALLDSDLRKSALEQFFRSEVTTGFSQRAFLESLDQWRISCIFEAERRDSKGCWPYPINSVLGFAVLACLRIFIAEALNRGNSLNSNPKESLLHCVVEASVAAANAPPWETHESTPLDLARMTQFLLERGASRFSHFKTMTPFQLLFSQCWLGWGGAFNSKISNTMLEIAENLLKYGEDPNTDIKIDGSNARKAVHVASFDMLQVLVEFGADLNLRDYNGRTTLDIAVGAAGNPYELGDHRQPEEAYRTVNFLIRNGARASNAGVFMWPLFLDLLNHSGGFDFSPENWEVPRLRENIYTRDINIAKQKYGTVPRRDFP